MITVAPSMCQACLRAVLKKDAAALGTWPYYQKLICFCQLSSVTDIWLESIEEPDSGFLAGKFNEEYRTSAKSSRIGGPKIRKVANSSLPAALFICNQRLGQRPPVPGTEVNNTHISDFFNFIFLKTISGLVPFNKYSQNLI
ncbi:MAG: hypothetical protein MO847_05560 [Candidatus Protistobacter heckmanni]|nr:hypothetical protein [Candidatus Protistobacter heckmanni]